MVQPKRMDIRSILSCPLVFKKFKYLINIDKYYLTFIEKYVCPKRGERILDIGCGYGDILEYLSDVEYTGFDMNQKYIDTAIKQYANRGEFLCKKLSQEAIKDSSCFDIVMAIGTLHHLNDEEAVELFKLARYVLKPAGRLVTIDPCYTDKQSLIARYLFSKDRGQFIRKEKEYLNLASGVFANPKLTIRHDLLRIPYTNIIMECKNENYF